MNADADRVLSWEARQRPRAGAAALLAAVCELVATFGERSLTGGAPKGSALETFERVGRGPVSNLPSLRIPLFEWVADHTTELIALSLVNLVAMVALAWAVGFLAVATRGRRPELKRWMIYLPIVGGVLCGLASPLSAIGQRQVASDFLDGPRTVASLEDIGSPPVAIVAALIGRPPPGLIGGFLLAVGFVLVSLNAMRAGLLTRFLGVLGMFSGVLVIFPVVGPVVETMWLGCFGLLVLGLWPGGLLPAWRTGRAEPWPARGSAPAAQRPAQKAAPARTLGGQRRKRKKRR